MGMSKDEKKRAKELKEALDDHDRLTDLKALGKATRDGDAEKAGELAAKYRGDDGKYHI